jgi:hypothetical protein
MKHTFIKEYKASVIMTAFLAILGLFSDYFHNQITMWKSIQGVKRGRFISKGSVI